MTFGKATALIAGLVGAMAFGVWVGPRLTDHMENIKGTTGTHAAPPAAPSAEATKTATPSRPRTPAARGDTASTTSTATTATVALSAPQLHKRLKPLLKPGADMAIVSEGFRNAEDFAATVHASKNTNVPFMILKHQVVDERKSLVSAIRESKPRSKRPSSVRMPPPRSSSVSPAAWRSWCRRWPGSRSPSIRPTWSRSRSSAPATPRRRRSR